MKRTESNENELTGLERMGVAQCRDLLGPAEQALDDEQVENLRDDYYNIARIICTQIMNEKRREVEQV
jgi:hypothetical protein